MNYNFFADRAVKIKLLNFIFEETDLRVFDLSSEPEKMVCEYKSANDIDRQFDLEYGGQSAVTFQLWSPRFSQEISFEKIDLDPAYCNGYTFRYRTSGFGLIQIYFGGLVKNELNYSHIGHTSEKRAQLWQDIVRNDDCANNWNWKEIEKTSRMLKSLIHNKWSASKIFSLGVMPGADALDKRGVKMGYFIRKSKI